MTTFQFMRKELAKCHMNYDRAMRRNATEDELKALLDKAEHYNAVCKMLKGSGGSDER